MAQTATMSVRFGADITNLEQGVERARRVVADAARTIGAESANIAQGLGQPFAQAAAGAGDNGTAAARAFVTAANATFTQTTLDLKAGLFRGNLTQEQFRQQGRDAAVAFNASVTQMLDQLAAAQGLSPQAKATLVRAYKTAGLEAGAAFAQGAAQITAQAAPATGAMSALSAASAKYGEQIARVSGGTLLFASSLDTNTTSSRRMFTALEGLAIMVGGPTFGLPLAIGIQLVESLTDSFMKSGKEAKAAAKSFADSLAQMTNAGDKVGIKQQLLDLKFGLPSGGRSTAGGFGGGMLDLEQQIRLTRAQIAQAQRAGSFTSTSLIVPGAGMAPSPALRGLEKQLDSLTTKMTVAQAKYRQLSGLLANWPGERIMARDTPPIVIGGTAPGRAASGGGSAARAESDLVQRANTLVGFKRSDEEMTGLSERAIATYDALSAAIAQQTDRYSALSLSLVNARRSLLDFRDVAMARGSAGPDWQSVVQQTPTVDISKPSPMPMVKDPTGLGGKVSTSVAVMPGKIDLLRSAVVAEVRKNAASITGALIATLGVRARGAAGSIGGMLGGAVGAGVGTFAAGTIGAGLGAAIGSSVLPVVGTIAGALLGTAIGNLFGGRKKAADDSSAALDRLARAANAVTDALTNVPTGFKIAYERWRVTDPTARGIYGDGPLPPTSGRSARGGTQITITGPVTVTGVKDTAAFFTELSQYARSQSLRGGSNAWRLVMAGT